MDTKLSCQEVCDAAHDLVDGVLPVGEAEAVRGHLQGCAGCRAHVEQLQTTVQLLQQLAPLPGALDSKPQLVEAFQAWHAELQTPGAQPVPEAQPSLWQRCLARRHWGPALRLSVLIFPVLVLVNHSMCILHMKMGAVCLGQSLLLTVVPFLVALYSSARSEHQAALHGL